MAKRGRSSKYRKDYHPQALVAFFDIPATKTVKQTRITKAGTVLSDVEVANSLPTIEGFCRQEQISKATFHSWTDKHSEFLNAYERVKVIQKDILVQNALTGRYVEGFAKFVAINCTDMVDKKEVELSGNLSLADRIRDARERAKDRS